MKALIAALAVAIGLGIVSAMALMSVQRLAYQEYATSSTRVSSPGNNLVGPRWTGST